MNTNTNTAPEREEIEQLLPWHAAGTLSRRDAQRVEQESGPATQAKPRFSFTTWMAERMSALSPRTLAYATAAATLAIVLQFGLLTGVAVNTALSPGGGGGFQTAS